MANLNPVIPDTHRAPRKASDRLRQGVRAPGFELPDADLNLICFKELCGHSKFVLYFYPCDDTPCCTAEALEFSELEMDFRECGTLVFGVSRDDCMVRSVTNTVLPCSCCRMSKGACAAATGCSK